MLEKSEKRIHFFTYLLLLFTLYDSIFRKWILPQYSDIIMTLKYGIAVIIFLLGIKYITKNRDWEIGSILTGFCVFLLTLGAGHGNLLVALWGCMPLVIGIPICYIMSRVIEEKDLIRIGQILVFTSIINSIVIITQFTLPVTNILNFQGGEISANIEDLPIEELSGIFRPSGIFQHDSHNALFSIFSYGYILYFLFIQKRTINKYVLICAFVLSIASCICSVSRTNVFYLIGMSVFFVIATTNYEEKKSLLKRILLIAPLIAIAMSTPIMDSAVNNISDRFAIASEKQFGNTNVTEGTLADIYNRTIAYNISAIISPQTIDGREVPFWGFGQGMSTQVGGKILGIKENSGFSLAEWDGLRIMCESGLLFGWIIIFIRIGYTLRFFPRLKTYKKKNMKLSLTLYPVFLISFFLMTNWGNLFQSCISFIIAALFLASTKLKNYPL